MAQYGRHREHDTRILTRPAIAFEELRLLLMRAAGVQRIEEHDFVVLIEFLPEASDGCSLHHRRPPFRKRRSTSSQRDCVRRAAGAL